MMNILRKGILALALLVVLSCKEKDKTSSRTSIETEEIAFTKQGELEILSAEGEERMKLAIELAQSEYEQQTGLMYRKSMKEDQGMLFIYEDEKPRPNFYMKNTFIALDLIYINSKNEVVDLYENAEPLSEKLLSSNAPAQFVLEVNAGLIAKKGIQLGDRVVYSLN